MMMIRYVTISAVIWNMRMEDTWLCFHNNFKRHENTYTLGFLFSILTSNILEKSVQSCGPEALRPDSVRCSPSAVPPATYSGLKNLQYTNSPSQQTRPLPLPPPYELKLNHHTVHGCMTSFPHLDNLETVWQYYCQYLVNINF